MRRPRELITALVGHRGALEIDCLRWVGSCFVGSGGTIFCPSPVLEHRGRNLPESQQAISKTKVHLAKVLRRGFFSDGFFAWRRSDARNRMAFLRTCGGKKRRSGPTPRSHSASRYQSP